MALASMALVALAACDPETTNDDAGAPDASAPALPSHCENINPAHCLLPWPSSFFLRDDPDTATGRRLALPAEAMPTDMRGRPVDPAAWNRADGFSPATSIVTSFVGELDPSLLADEDHVADTLLSTSTTVIVDAETGARVAHAAELDEWPATDPARAPLYLRPIARLRPGARYVVGIRGLRTRDGAAVEASDFFAALRDGTTLPGADVAARVAELEAIFTTLDAAGVPRGELIEAFAFDTASDAPSARDLLAMRDDALEALGPDGLGCTVTEVEDASLGDELGAGVWRRVQGTFTAPSFLVGDAPDEIDDAYLLRDADGRPTERARVSVPFLVLVPESVRASVAAGGEPARFVVYGHGILGSRFEADADWLRDAATSLELVTASTDWWGMSRDDLPRLVETLSGELGSFSSTPERLHQGVVNTLALMRAFRGTCASLDALQVPLDGGGTAPAYAPDVTYFYGNSLGAILGGTLAGVATDAERFVLGVGGASWSYLIKRSDAWRTFGSVIAIGYEDPLERDLLIAMTATLWDPIDAATYAPHLLEDPLPGTPVKRVMMQIGIGDVAVSNDAAFYQARTAGIPLLLPSPAAPYGLATTEGPADSALTVFALPGVEPLPPGTRDPGADTPTHNGVRSIDAAQVQLDAFLRPDGRVAHVCDGPCDPD